MSRNFYNWVNQRPKARLVKSEMPTNLAKSGHYRLTFEADIIQSIDSTVVELRVVAPEGTPITLPGLSVVGNAKRHNDAHDPTIGVELALARALQEAKIIFAESANGRVRRAAAIAEAAVALTEHRRKLKMRRAAAAKRRTAAV